jgi:hypothetical protein
MPSSNPITAAMNFCVLPEQPHGGGGRAMLHFLQLVWYGYLFIVHILLIFFIDMSLNILSFSLNLSLHYLQTIGSAGMSDIYLKSVQHQVQSQRTVGALAWRVKMGLGLHDHGKL